MPMTLILLLAEDLEWIWLEYLEVLGPMEFPTEDFIRIVSTENLVDLA
jgi:hypothetical protein